MSIPLVVGVTGGIGSGKTTVVEFFEELKVPAYIADQEAKKLMLSDTDLVSSIKNEFGSQSYLENNSLNKAFLSEQVFTDEKKLKKLNTLVHPVVRKDFKLWLSKQNTSYVVYESALIFETQQQDFFDLIILVTAPEDLRIKRVMKRSGISKNEIKNRINKQMPDNLKKRYVNYVIDNLDKRQTKLEIIKINDKILNKIK